MDGRALSVDYEPSESRSRLFGGNSNWRGPIWFPTNFLIIESLQKFSPLLRRRLQDRVPNGFRNIYHHRPGSRGTHESPDKNLPQEQ
jgi:hypothetical protein